MLHILIGQENSCGPLILPAVLRQSSAHSICLFALQAKGLEDFGSHLMDPEDRGVAAKPFNCVAELQIWGRSPEFSVFSEVRFSDEEPSFAQAGLRFKTELGVNMPSPFLLSQQRVCKAEKDQRTRTHPCEAHQASLVIVCDLGGCPSRMCHGNCWTHGYRAVLLVYCLSLQSSHPPMAGPHR